MPEYKVGQKAVARIISTDPIHKTITLSMNENVVQWRPTSSAQSSASALSQTKIGHVFKNAKVAKVLYGGSYLLRVQLEDGQELFAFLHKTHSK